MQREAKMADASLSAKRGSLTAAWGLPAPSPLKASHMHVFGTLMCFRLAGGENQKKRAAVQQVCRNELESVRNETDSRSRLVFGRVPAQNQKNAERGKEIVGTAALP